MKPNIVFDMGRVLMDFAPPTFIARLGYTGDDAKALLQEDPELVLPENARLAEYVDRLFSTYEDTMN